MPSLKFIVPGNPVGKERPRKGKHGNFYTPQKTKDFEEKVALFWLGYIHPQSKKGQNIRWEIAKAPKVGIHVMCYFKNQRHPDMDNVYKNITDALQRIGLGNDKRFYGGMSFDFDKENPRTEVTISWK